MPLRVKFRRPPLRGVLFVLLLFGGLIPLVLVNVMLVTAVPRDGRELETGAIIAGSAVLLVALAWILSGWAAAAVVEPARRLSEAMGSLAGGRFETWVSPPTGAVRELAGLSEEVNRMSALTLRAVRKLEQTERDNAALATDAMRLFKQAVQAKEPLTKHHPGLLEAYSKAVARQMGDRSDDVDSAEIALSPFTDPAKLPPAADTRAQPRYPVDDLMMESPVAAKILDVSSIGLKLETMESLPLGRQDLFVLVARSHRLPVAGRVSWCRLVRTIKVASGDPVAVYRAGVKFEESTATEVREELLEVIRIHRQVARTA